MAQFDSLIHNSLSRTFLVHVPIGYNSGVPTPLIIAMHGGFGSATNLQDQSLLSIKADAENFIVVYPEGVKSPLNIRTWNAGWCCGYASNNNIDDVGFISTLIDTMISRFNIDTLRMYATGMSNGGFMSYRLACELSHRIAAIAPVAASMSVPVCNPSRPVPILQVHSYLDTSVPYLGGIGGGVSNHYNPPHDSVLNVWALKNDCSMANDTIDHNSQYTHIRWSDCECNALLDYYITTDGGHSWAGGSQTVIGDPPSLYLNANDLMWDFFQQHSLECDSVTSLYDPSPNLIQLSAFPNPSHDWFYFNVENVENAIVTDFTGRTMFVLLSGEEEITGIDLSDVPAGIYIVQITFHNGDRAFTKLIKMRK